MKTRLRELYKYIDKKHPFIGTLLRRIYLRNYGAVYKAGEMSYSQGGEDMILNCIFLSKNKGFYVDVGANHPAIGSNTCFFYKKGWTGINIDALPDAVQLFRKQRKKDINITAGVSDKEGIMKFYVFKETSLNTPNCCNTFDEEILDDNKKLAELKEVISIPVKPLSLLLSQFNITSIDFMSIDVEGLDLNVLKSNDWNTFRPKVILVEDFSIGNNITNSKIYEYMLSLGYVYLLKTVTNAFYIEKDFFNERFKGFF